MFESSFSIAKVDDPKKMVWIIDNDRGKSVTNDAQRVCLALNQQYQNYRIIYRDTMGLWDELAHVNGIHHGFLPAREFGLGL